MYTIYALVDPRDYTVHYVGQTTDVYQRFTQHINGEGSSFVKNAWIFELRALNRMVIMETLEQVGNYQFSLEREAYWIKHFETLSEPLTNATHRLALKEIKKLQVQASRQIAIQAVAALEVKNRPDSSRDGYIPRGDDKFLPENLHDDLQYWYRKVGNVNDALAKMGITNSRYRRHAAYVLEQCGLKRRA